MSICCFCDAPLPAADQPSPSRRVVTQTKGNLAVEPEWRQEVSTRLKQYRARRNGGVENERQTPLPFETVSASVAEPPISSRGYSREGPAPPGTRRRRVERFEISVPSQDQIPGLLADAGAFPSEPSAALAHTPLFPVASIKARQQAGLLDGAMLSFAFGGMLALFTVLGGQIGFNRLDLAVAGATFGLFYAQYIALFTIFGGSTPGMMLRGLRVVSYDGSVPSSRQMAWRSFGYLVSAGTCFLGFLWALWDEDHLCWHDRISQTYLTRLEELRQ